MPPAHDVSPAEPQPPPVGDRHFEATFENAPVGIARVTGDGRWSRVNQALCSILGDGADRLVNRPIWDLSHPQDQAAVRAWWAEARDGGDEGGEHEGRFVRADGQMVWLRLVVRRVQQDNQDGNPETSQKTTREAHQEAYQHGGGADAFIAVVEDVSARRKLAERRRREAELLEQSSDAILSWRLGGGIVYWSPGAERLYGFTREEAMGRRCFELLKTKSRIPVSEIEAEVAEQGNWYGKLVHTTRDGREVTVESRHVLVSYDGEPCALATSRDISIRNRAEDELLLSEERFRLSILNSPTPIMLFDDREDILAVSDSWLEASGYSRDELRRLQNWTDLAYRERSSEVLAVLRDIIANQPHARPSEGVIRTKNGEERVWGFIKTGLETQFDRRVLFVTVAQDLTERKEREAQISMLMREVTHRSKNLLSIVQAIARLTAERTPEEFIECFTSRIHALAANHDVLVRNEWKGVNADELVGAQLAYLAHLIGTRIVLDGPQIRLNAAAAQAIGFTLHELATNAGKYGALSTDGGRVDLKWRRDGDSFVMSWVETGGPTVQAPEHGGFGSTVIEAMVKHAVGGEVAVDYRPAGLMWAMRCPAENALEPPGDAGRPTVVRERADC